MSDSGVLLVRHGKAEDGHPLGDKARALTTEGRREFREHAQRLAATIRLTSVITSPLVRAVQTAEVLADALGIDGIVVARELSTDGSAERLADFAREVGTGHALVGHNPTIAEAVSLLLGRRGEPRFRKGAAAALAPVSGKAAWRLLWTASPGRGFETELD